jgi:hypothetical protein
MEVGDLQVANPDAEAHEREWEMDIRLVTRVDPIVDGHAGRNDAESAVKNLAWFLVDFCHVDHGCQ